jgi:hypothetical protein
VYQNQRLTLTMTFVRKSDGLVKILGRLFKRLEVLKIRIKKAYLDKGFYSIAVIRFFKARNLPFINSGCHAPDRRRRQVVRRSGELYDRLHLAQSETRLAV